MCVWRRVFIFKLTQFDERVGEFLAVDGDATQQVDELVEGEEVIQQHPVVHLVFTLRDRFKRFISLPGYNTEEKQKESVEDKKWLNK